MCTCYTYIYTHIHILYTHSCVCVYIYIYIHMYMCTYTCNIHSLPRRTSRSCGRSACKAEQASHVCTHVCTCKYKALPSQPHLTQYKVASKMHPRRNRSAATLQFRSCFVAFSSERRTSLRCVFMRSILPMTTVCSSWGGGVWYNKLCQVTI